MVWWLDSVTRKKKVFVMSADAIEAACGPALDAAAARAVAGEKKPAGTVDVQPAETPAPDAGPKRRDDSPVRSRPRP